MTQAVEGAGCVGAGGQEPGHLPATPVQPWQRGRTAGAVPREGGLQMELCVQVTCQGTPK